MIDIDVWARDNTEKSKKYRQIADMCKNEGLTLPKEILEFYNVTYQDELTCVGEPMYVVKVEDIGGNGYRIKKEDLPKDFEYIEIQIVP